MFDWLKRIMSAPNVRGDVSPNAQTAILKADVAAKSVNRASMPNNVDGTGAAWTRNHNNYKANR